MYPIEFTPEALEERRALRKFDQKLVWEGVKGQLLFEPATPTANRQPTRPNDVAGWELKIGKFRVFYDVAEGSRVVTIEAIGIKLGSLLYIRGEERRL